LIGVVQVSFSYVVDNVWEEMAKRELKEITDYVADTVANVYFLANSTNSQPVVIQKTLDMPSEIAGLSYSMNIASDARSVKAYFNGKSWLSTESWLPPGLTVDAVKNKPIEGNGKTVVVTCSQTPSTSYIWMAYG